MPKQRNKIDEVTTLDKYEYKVRADEIKALIAEGEYAKAVEIADTIDWRRVKSVMMLCTISDLYKINRRYEDSKNILLLAYEKHPGGRLIVYSLCELSIKLEEYVQAIEYYKEFVQLAPRDTGRYVLQYKLYEAQEVSLEERIAVLEELKNKEYREKWMYELAYLYHRVGLETKCVEECDEMYLWFGEGRYVMKALELKQLHQPLSEDQQQAYAKMKQDIMGVSVSAGDTGNIRQEALEAPVDEEENEFSREVTVLTDPTQKMPAKEELDEIQVKTVDVSQYNTINLQKELAESMREFLENNQTVEIPADQVADALGETKVIGPVNVNGMQEIVTEEMPVEEVAEAFEAQTAETKLQEEAPATEEYKKRSITEEIFFGDTSEVTVEDVLLELEEQDAKAKEESAAAMAMTGALTTGAAASGMVTSGAAASGATVMNAAMNPNSAMINTGVIRAFNKPSGYDNILSQDSDGQISLVVPEQEKVEKQITGQLSIDDIMAEWEKIKKENEQKRMADIRERVQQHTGSLFANFDESAKTGLLEELEKSMAEADKPRVIKVSDIEKLDAEAAFAAGLTDELPVEEVEEVVEEIAEEVAEEIAEASESEVVEEVAEEVTEAVETVAEEAETVETADEEAEELVEEIVEEAEPEIADAATEETVEKITEEVAEDIEEASESEVTEKVAETVEIAAEKEEEIAEEVEEAEMVVETATEAADEEAVREVEEAAAEEVIEEAVEESEEVIPDEKPETSGKYRARELTKQESELFAPFIHHKKTRRQIADAIDHISMASYTGNVIITGEESAGNLGLAKLLVKEVQMSDDNFSGKVAKISASTLNTKDVAATLDKLEGGALIIEGASALSDEVVSSLLKEMNQEDKGLIILMEDRKPLMNAFLSKNEEMQTLFNLRVDLEALDDQTLVRYAKKYAYEQEYVIDEVAVLALHKRIADMQTSDHEVTMAEIEELVDEAIYYADKKTPKHFFDILIGKRYDEEDMIILREADFMHD